MGLLLIVLLLGLVPMVQSQPAPPPPILAVTLLIQEELPIGTRITNLITEARLSNYYSAESLANLRFVLMNKYQDTPDIVTVDDGANVHVKENIDRDELCPNQETCEIVLDFTLQPFADFNNLLKLTLQIMDINDNAPQFGKALFTTELSESSIPGARIVLPGASDADSQQFSVKEYQLTGNEDGVFELQVVQNPGSLDDVSLILRSSVDREEVERIEMKLIAYDGGNPPKSGSVDIRISIIDANDNAPVFSHSMYNVTIPEDTLTGTTILQVVATDVDVGENGEVTYSLAPSTSPAVAAMFGVDARSGAVYTLSSLDHETGAAHFLSIESRDHGAPTALTAYTKVKVIIVDVNDHAPEISVHALGGDVVQVVENAGAGTLVAQISVQDPDSGDNGKFSCHLDSAEFSLQTLYTASEFKLLTTSMAVFDREKQDSHSVRITCTDHGEVPQTSSEFIEIKIVDVNDHTPMFMQLHYTAEILENRVPGTYVLRVNATDSDIEQNSKIVYSIEPVNGPSVLNIQPGTGIVTTAEMLDFEQQTVYAFKVKAQDQGQPSRSTETTLTLTVQDVNDCTPEFEHPTYSFGTFENQPVGTEISTLKANDADSFPYDIITYSLDRQNPHSSKFHIDARTGKLTTKRILDREEESEYHLKIYASNEDYYLTGSVNITIHIADKNDNAPIIYYPNEHNNTIQISTLTQKQVQVIQITAHDPDVGQNQELTFSILSGNEAGLFDIDPIHGWIVTNQDLSPLSSQKETIVVLVQDHGEPVMSSVTQLHIQLNDSLALMTKSPPQRISNTVAAVIISFLVLAIIVIIAVLLILVIMRRKRSRRLRKSRLSRETPPDSMVMTSVTDVTEAEDDNKRNMQMVDEDTKVTTHEAPASAPPPYYPERLLQVPQRSSGRHQLGRRREGESCQLREIQLQVRDLLDVYHDDADRDSLTDSGKGPSEEGDGKPHALHSPTPSKLTDYRSTSFGDDTFDDTPVGDSDSLPPTLPPRRGKLPCKNFNHPYVNVTIPPKMDGTNSLNRYPQRPSNPPLYREAVQRASFGPSWETCPKHGTSFRSFSPPQPYLYAPAKSHDQSHDQESEGSCEDVSGESTTTSGSFVLEPGSDIAQCQDVFV